MWNKNKDYPPEKKFSATISPLLILIKVSIRKILKQLGSINIFQKMIDGLPEGQYTYIYSGIYVLVYAIESMLSIGYKTQYKNDKYNFRVGFESLSEIIYTCLILIGICLIMLPLNSSINRRQRAFLLNILLFCSLVILPFFIVIETGFGKQQFLIFMINIMVLAQVLYWEITVIMLVLGISIAFMMSHFLDPIDTYMNIRFRGIYIYPMIMICGVLFTFLRPKEKNYLVTQKLNKKLEHQINIRTQELKSALEIKKDFINNLSHEIRTPIHGINALSEGLYANWDLLDEKKQKNYVQQIAKNSKRLFSFLENILDLSELSNQNIQKILLKEDFKEIINDVLVDLEILNHSNKPFTIKKIYSSKNFSVECNKFQITQVIKNFLSNAIKYSDQGLIELGYKFIKNNQYILFWTKDQGIGIPEKEKLLIFAPFRQSSSTKNMANGKGLGLSICYKIISNHKGKIWAENNTPNKGSTFYFQIPVTQNIQSSSINQEQYTEPEYYEAHTITTLLHNYSEKTLKQQKHLLAKRMLENNYTLKEIEKITSIPIQEIEDIFAKTLFQKQNKNIT